MKRFLFTVFVFLLPLVIGYVYLEKKLQTIRNSYNQKKWAIEKQLPDIEVLVVGSSNALSGVDPVLFSHKGFNMSNTTQTIYYDEHLVEYYLDKLPKLKMVIVPVDYAFHRQLDLMSEGWREYFYKYYWGIKVANATIFDMKQYSLLASYSPNTAIYYIKKRFNVSAAPKYEESGYFRRDSVGHKKYINDSMGIGREAYLSRFYSEASILKSRASLEHIINMLQARKVEVVLISIPFYHTLAEHLDQKIVARNNEIINEMRSKYHLKYFSYTSDPRFDIDDFRNCDHMDSAGAVKLSTILDNEIIRPILN